MKDFSTMQIKRERKKMETLCIKDGDRINDGLISHFKDFSFFEVEFVREKKKKTIEVIANGNKGTDISRTKICKVNFVVSVHSSSQGLFILDT